MLLVHLYAVVWVTVIVLGTYPLGHRPVVVASASMAPTLAAGDLILVGPVGNELKPGAVVTFRSPADPDRLITHRVVSVNDDGEILTKGDANSAPDSTPTPREAVVGASRFSIPLVGRPVLWLQSGRWVPLTIWLSVTLGSVLAIFDRRSTPIRRPSRTWHPRLTNRSLAVLLAGELLACAVLLLNLLAGSGAAS